MALEGPNGGVDIEQYFADPDAGTIEIETYREGMDDSAMIPAGAPPREVGESFYDWSMRTGLPPLLGPGDLDEIISEPDYEESLRKSVRIFGGTVDDYRSPGMTQEQWAAIGTTWHLKGPGERQWSDPYTDVAGDFATRGFLAPPAPFTAEDFFPHLDAMSPCCRETLGIASESLAVLERDLFRKAAETLDEARLIANRTSDANALVFIANSYRDLASAAS